VKLDCIGTRTAEMTSCNQRYYPRVMFSRTRECMVHTASSAFNACMIFEAYQSWLRVQSAAYISSPDNGIGIRSLLEHALRICDTFLSNAIQ